MPACARRIISMPTALAIAKARAAVINQAGNAKALLDAVPEAARHDPGYMFSRIQWLRRADKIAEAAQWLQRGAARSGRTRSMSISGGSSGGWLRASCSISAMPEWPMRSPTARRRRRTKTIAPSSNLPPAGSRCASCAQPAIALVAFRPHRRRRVQSDHAGALVLLAGPRRRGAGARAGRARPITRRRRAIRPPITASWRAPGSASTK